jgi:hypothetical protein
MEKLEKLEKVKILRDGQEVDAYLNIAEDVHSRIFGKTFDDVTLTIFGEFLDVDKNPVYHKQIVTEYDGIRDVFKIPKLLNKKIVNDDEIEEYQDKKFKLLQDNLPLLYKFIEEVDKKVKQGEANE